MSSHPSIIDRVFDLLARIDRDYGPANVPAVLPLLQDEWDQLRRELDAEMDRRVGWTSLQGIQVNFRQHQVELVLRAPFVDQVPAAPEPVQEAAPESAVRSWKPHKLYPERDPPRQDWGGGVVSFPAGVKLPWSFWSSITLP